MVGRPSVFQGKDRKGRWIQGLMTPAGYRAFELARKRLGRLYASVMGQKLTTVSDGDTVEYLARGEAETRVYLMDRRR